MSVDRPTFSESWYRVADLRPRLRSDVQIVRQHYRGQTWHVLQDPANNQYFRLPESGYRFVGMLDGRRTVNDVWDAVGAQLGDDAPTQGEAIQLLAQLYLNNLLAGDMPPDAESLFSRYRKRRMREIQSRLANIMFLHFPIYDPDRLLNAWVGAIGWFFGPVGLVLWALVVGFGTWSVLGHIGELFSRGTAEQILSGDNLVYLYAAMALIKGIHEFGHAFACKRMGRKTGTGGEVHEMGIMLLIFTPLPYVEASSAWSFRNKWRRIFVSSAGMYVEIFVAAIAAIIWSRTGEGQIVHALAYNMMFIASVSTILFNANPLLRYDGYYILSDLLEMPNLRQRANQYIYYLVKKYVWGVRRPQNPANTTGERVWFVFYGIAATIYRVFISVAIILFIGQKFLLIGALMAVTAAFVWGVLPLAKFVRYLFTNQELSRVRVRAIATTGVTLAVVLVAIGLIPARDDTKADGVVVARTDEQVRARESGQVSTAPGTVLPDGTPVRRGQLLIQLESPQLQAERQAIRAELDEALTSLDKSRAEGTADQDDLQLVAAIRRQIARVEQQIADLTVTAPEDGVWVSPDAASLPGRHVRRGEMLGRVVSLDSLEVQAVITQAQADRWVNVGGAAWIRRRGAADMRIGGTVRRSVEAGQNEPPAMLTAPYGGPIVLAQMPGTQRPVAAEPYFDIRVTPENQPQGWYVGQRVQVRFAQEKRPLLVQWYRLGLQTIQKRWGQ